MDGRSEILEYITKAFSKEEDAFQLLLSSIKNNTPCGLVRLGDGEAKVIGYPNKVSRGKVDHQFKIWFGDRVVSDIEVYSIQSELLKSFEANNIIGMPTYLRCTQKDKYGNLTSDAKNCLILWTKLLEIYGHAFFDSKVIVSANYHHWLQKSKGIKRVLTNTKNLYLINHTCNISQYLIETLDLDSFCFISIPGESWSRKEEVSKHYPNRYNQVRKMIMSKTQPGDVYIIGAGVLGKIYSMDVISKGGIALDMGAIIDSWNDVIPSQRGMLIRKKEQMSMEYVFS